MCVLGPSLILSQLLKPTITTSTILQSYPDIILALFAEAVSLSTQNPILTSILTGAHFIFLIFCWIFWVFLMGFLVMVYDTYDCS